MTLSYALRPMVFVLALNFAFDYFESYETLFELDSFVHFMGGVATAMTVGRLMRWSEGCYHTPALEGWFRCVLGVVSVGFIAFLWEVYEFGVSELFNVVMQPGIADTMIDVVMGTVGGFIWFLRDTLRLSPTRVARAERMSSPTYVEVPVEVTKE